MANSTDSSEASPNTEHTVDVHLILSDDEMGSETEREVVFELEDDLEKAIAECGGELEGDLFGGGEAVVYLFGPDADAIFRAIEPVLTAYQLPNGGYAIKRYGEADDATAREERVELAASEVDD